MQAHAVEIVALRAIPPIDWRGVPQVFVGKVSAVCWSLRDCEELTKWYGDPSFAPFLPVLVKAPGGWSAIAGFGIADAAELQDCAIVLWTRQAEALAQRGTLFDFDELRYRRGLIERAKAGPAMAEAFEARIQKHKANPVTDPFRKVDYPRVNERVLFAVDGTKDGYEAE